MILTLYADSVRIRPACKSCDEYADNACKKNPDVCTPRPPDFACQTKEIYIQHFTGGEMVVGGATGERGGIRDWLLWFGLGRKEYLIWYQNSPIPLSMVLVKLKILNMFICFFEFKILIVQWLCFNRWSLNPTQTKSSNLLLNGVRLFGFFAVKCVVWGKSKFLCKEIAQLVEGSSGLRFYVREWEGTGHCFLGHFFCNFQGLTCYSPYLFRILVSICHLELSQKMCGICADHQMVENRIFLL